MSPTAAITLTGPCRSVDHLFAVVLACLVLWWMPIGAAADDTGNAGAISDEAFSKLRPPNWPALTAEGDRVRVWGREFKMAASGLPASVESQGQPVLGAAVRLEASVGGEAVEWTPVAEAPTLLAHNDAVAHTQGVVRGPGFTVTTQARFEFDGMAWFTVTVAPDAGLAEPPHLDSLRIVIPYLDESSALMHWWSGGPDLSNPKVVQIGSPGYDFGPLFSSADRELVTPAPGVEGSFIPYLMLTGMDYGMAWFAESDAGWTRSDTVPAVAMSRDETTCLVDLTLNLFAAPTVLVAPRTISFGLHPTPVRPPDALAQATEPSPPMPYVPGQPWRPLQMQGTSYLRDLERVVSVRARTMGGEHGDRTALIQLADTLPLSPPGSSHFPFLAMRQAILEGRRFLVGAGVNAVLISDAPEGLLIPCLSAVDVFEDGHIANPFVSPDGTQLVSWPRYRLRFMHPAKWGIPTRLHTPLPFRLTQPLSESALFRHRQAMCAALVLHGIDYTPGLDPLFQSAFDRPTLRNLLAPGLTSIPYWRDGGLANHGHVGLLVAGWRGGEGEPSHVMLYNTTTKPIDATVELHLDLLGLPDPEQERVYCAPWSGGTSFESVDTVPTELRGSTLTARVGPHDYVVVALASSAKAIEDSDYAPDFWKPDADANEEDDNAKD